MSSINIQSIPWKSLKPSPLNPRRSSSDKGLSELAASIAEKGILQNLTARKDESAKTYLPPELHFVGGVERGYDLRRGGGGAR